MSFNYLGIAIKNLVDNPIKSLSYCNSEQLLRVKIAHDELPFLLDSLKELDFIDEVSIISTCNRFEIYFFSNRQLNNADVLKMQNIIFKFNKSNLSLNFLSGRDAELHFIRTYCGLNSGLVSEHEIVFQIQIAFQQCLKMNYLSTRARHLLEFASRIRKKLDIENIFDGGFSYCNVAITQSLKNLNLFDLSKLSISVLGSGGTALKSVLALLKLNAQAHNINIIHRISSSSSQVDAFREVAGFNFMRAKNGYHVDRVKNSIYSSDLVVFGIDSKNPVVNLDKNLKNKILDFNSNSSCTFSIGYDLKNYRSAADLEGLVRDFSERNLNNEGFKSKIFLAENYIKSLTADTLISKI